MNGKMQIIVDSKLRIKNPSEAVMRWCNENLILDNPDYYKLEKMGKWTGNTPKQIWLYEKMGDTLWLPFGCLRDIWPLLKGASYKVLISPVRSVFYQSSINLYPYQKNAVEAALSAKNGVLVMPCGSGKTQCGLEIISRIGGRALWLTHTQDLLNQSKKRAESVLSTSAYGTITAGRVNAGKSITFATVQTMSKLDLSRYRDQWDAVIVDECQHAAGTPTRVTQFYKVISSLCARYKIGLTATPRRADGLETAMFALLGGVIHEVSRDEVAGTTCPIKVLRVDTGWTPDYSCVLMGDGTIDYNKVIDAMINDGDRYDLVLSQLKMFVSPCIVLANRVEYLRRMCDDYNKYQYGDAVCLSGMSQSKKAKAERKAALEALNSGELDCLFCTYQLAAEGLDVPNLRWVVLATPEKDPTRVQQATGRVGRKASGKDIGRVIDFVDDCGMYRGWWKKRASLYKKLGYEMEE